MAGLQSQIVSVPFNRGLDTKTDQKLVMPGKLLTLENGVFKKNGTIQKRFGTKNYQRSIMGSASSVAAGFGLATFQDELDLFADQKLYAFNATSENWADRGELTSLQVSHQPVLANEYTQSACELATNQGVTLFAWKDSRGGIRGSVIDETTGSQIQTDVLISATGDRPKCIAVGKFLYVFFKDSGNIKWRRVALGAPQTLSSESVVVSDLNTTESNFDIANFSSNMLLVYATSGNEIKLLYINDNGVASPSGLPALVTISERAANCIGITVNGLQIHVAYHNATNGVRGFGRDQNFAVLYAPVTLDSDITNSYVNITGAASQSVAGAVRWWYEQQNSTNSMNQLTKHNTVTSAGSVGSTAVFKRSVGLAAKSFVYNSRPYVPLVHESTLQSTFLILSETGRVVARFWPGQAGGRVTPAKLGALASLSSTKLMFANMVKTRIEIENNTIFTPTGVGKTIIDFAAQPIYSSAELGDNLHIVGGILYDYDGVSTFEHNFLFYPENVLVDVLHFNVTVKQQGTAGVPEITHVAFMHGDKITGGQYWTLTSATPTNYYVWYTKDGSGTDPAPGGKTAIPVAILSTDDAAAVATKTKTALDAVGGAPFITTRTNHLLVITNAANASVTDAANFDLGTNPFSVSVTTQGTSGVAEITSVTCCPASRITTGQYFLLNSSGDARTYYVWFNKDSAGGDPKVAGRIGIEVAILAADTNAQVATKLAAALDPLEDFIATVASNVVTVTCSTNGVVTDAVNVNVAGGSLANGSYLYAVIYRARDAQRQTHRSRPSPEVIAALAGFAVNDGKATLTIPTLRVTDRSNVLIDIYRTLKSDTTVFYRLTTLSNPIFNDSTKDSQVYTDTLPDEAIQSNEVLYTIQECFNDAPPSCSFLANFRNRLILKPDAKNEIWISKERLEGEAVGFSSLIVSPIDPAGGDITGLAGMDDKVVIFKPNAIRVKAGFGPNAFGVQDSFTPDENIPSPTGCTEPASIVVFDQGVAFKGKKGIYLLDRGLNVRYIGAPVEAFNALTITSATLIEDVNEVRFTTSDGVCLVYNYYFLDEESVGQWSVFTNYEAADALMWDSRYVHLKADGTVARELADTFQDEAERIILKLETAWLKLSGLQGFKRVWRAGFLGEYKSDHQFKVGMAFDYQPIIARELTWSPNGVINTSLYGSGSPYGADDPYGDQSDNVWQFQVKMPIQKCEAVKFTLEDVMAGTPGESFNITELALLVGVKKGMVKLRQEKTI